MLISTQTTAPEPSVIVGTPLKRGFPLPEEPLMQSSIGKSHCIAVRWATSERGPRPSNRAVGLSHNPRSQSHEQPSRAVSQWPGSGRCGGDYTRSEARDKENEVLLPISNCRLPNQIHRL